MGTIKFFRDFIVFHEGLAKIIQVSITNVLNCTVVNNECKHDGAPLVTPMSRGVGCFIVAKFGKAVLEEVVC